MVFDTKNKGKMKLINFKMVNKIKKIIIDASYRNISDL